MKKTLLLGASLLCSVFIMATEIPFQKAEIKVFFSFYIYLFIIRSLQFNCSL